MFKVGDTLLILGADADSDKIGETRKVVKANTEDVWLEGCSGPWSQNSKGLRLISSGETINQKESNMNTLSNMMKKFFDADTQTLVKAGYLNSDLSLSSKGKEANDAINFKANLKELVALAQADLDEEADKK